MLLSQVFTDPIKKTGEATVAWRDHKFAIWDDDYSTSLQPSVHEYMDLGALSVFTALISR